MRFYFTLLLFLSFFSWEAKSQERLNTHQIIKIARNYESKPNYRKAFETYQEAAKLGSDSAYYKIAEFYEFGLHGDRDLQSAFINYRISADKGFILGILKTAEFYQKGIGTVIDLKSSAEYYLHAFFKHDSPEAKRKLEYMDLEAIFNSKDPLYIKYKALVGDPRFSLEYGKILLKEGNFNEATPFLVKSCDALIPEACFLYATNLARGKDPGYWDYNLVALFARSYSLGIKESEVYLKKLPISQLYQYENDDVEKYVLSTNSALENHKIALRHEKKKNYDKAIQHFLVAGRNGIRIANLFASKLIIEKISPCDPKIEEPVNQLKEWTDNSEAQLLIYTYLSECSSKNNRSESFKYLLNAGILGNSTAQALIEKYDVINTLGIKDPSVALYLSKKGDARAHYELAQSALSNKDVNSAISYLEKSYYGGFSPALSTLISTLYFDTNNNAIQKEKAYMLCQREDINTFPEAYFILGEMCYKGSTNVSIRHDQAIEYLTKYIDKASNNSVYLKDAISILNVLLEQKKSWVELYRYVQIYRNKTGDNELLLKEEVKSIICIADNLLDEKKSLEARDIIQKVQVKISNRGDLKTSDILGYYYFVTGRYLKEIGDVQGSEDMNNKAKSLKFDALKNVCK